MKTKFLGAVGELIVLPDGNLPTQNIPFPKALKKAQSEQAIPESSAYFLQNIKSEMYHSLGEWEIFLDRLDVE